MSILVKDLNCSINGKQLLGGINTEINSSKIIGIIGPNGAGKSTLLKCLSGLIETSGKIQLNKKPLESYSPSRLAGIRAALPQENSLNFPFKSRDIIAMSFALSKISNMQQEIIIQKCLEIVNAKDLINRHFLNLSGGEKQRIHIARVLAQLLQNTSTNQMRYLFLDEPTAPLDLKYQFLLFSHLKKILKKNISSIIVLHDINLAATYCDEIWVMKEGQLIYQDKPQKVISDSMMKSVFDVEVKIAFQRDNLLPLISNSIYKPHKIELKL